MYTEIRSLPDAELSALILAGAGGQQLGVTHAMGIGGSASPTGNLVLARLLACANELLKRQAISTLSQRDCLDKMDHVGEYFVRHFRFHQRETFVVMFLDVQHRLICVEEMFRGTLTQTPVYPREVVKRALELNASSLILAHNHPSGECDASSADEHITAKLKSALALVDTKLLDHFIVAGDSYQSMAKADLL